MGFNLKGKFKNIGKSVLSDGITVVSLKGAQKGLSLVPSNIMGKDISPAIKGAGGYLLVRMFLGGSKGIMQNVANGAALGCLSVAASPILEKVGIGSNIDEAYLGGSSEFIRITGNAGSKISSDNAFVDGL